MGKYLSIVLPTALISMLMLSTFCTFVGRKEHVRDESERLVQMPEVEIKNDFSLKVKIGVISFLLCVMGILTFGIFPNLMPQFNVNGDVVKVEMTEIVQFFMYLSATINLLLIKSILLIFCHRILHNLQWEHFCSSWPRLVRCNNI